MQSVRYYGLAFVIILIAELVTTGLQLAGSYLPADHPAALSAANISGLTLGGVIMVIGFLKDNRVEQERQRTEEERQRTEQERQRADAAEARLQQERERADQLLAELMEARKKNRDEIEARLRRLEERLDGNPPQADGEQ